MSNIFIGKDKQPYSALVLSYARLLQNPSILDMYTMKELDVLYTKYFGTYSDMYPSILKEKIKHYDTSKEINGFIFDNKEFWFDKSTRLGLMHLANCSTDNVQVVLGDNVLSMSPEVLKDFLRKLEVYAGQCYVQTQKHLIAVDSLKSVDDILNYDYTIGYPAKIVLSID